MSNLQVGASTLASPASAMSAAWFPTHDGDALQRGRRRAHAELPTLLGRLGALRILTLVIWGESDGVTTADYGRAYAAGISNARFELVREAGHLPHLEQPAATFRLVDAFLASDAKTATA